VIVPYRWLWVLAVMFGSVLSLPIVWTFADIANGLMAIPNLVALLGLSGVVVAETRHFLWDRNLDEDAEGSIRRNTMVDRDPSVRQ
jgi:AGCS family alanine or glycine:cation symporter